MPQFAGQMLPNNNPLINGPNWVPANGAWHFRIPGGQDYYARINWRSGMVGIGRFRIPNVSGWQVLLRDNPTGPTLPPDTPTAERPPTAAAGVVSINNISSPQTAGPVAVSGLCTANAPVSCAPVVGGVPGAFTPMTTTGTSWSGSVTMAAGASVQIQARLTNATFVISNSNTFAVT
jgi:hypothetical protein